MLFCSKKLDYFKPNSFIALVSQLIASDWFFGFFCSKAMVMTYIQVTKCINSRIHTPSVGTKYHLSPIFFLGIYFLFGDFIHIKLNLQNFLSVTVCKK